MYANVSIATLRCGPPIHEVIILAEKQPIRGFNRNSAMRSADSSIDAILGI